MASPPELLREKDFWRYYCGSGEDEIDSEFVEKYAVDEDDEGDPTFLFPLTFNARCSLRVDVETEIWALSLSLVDPGIREPQELGWWDEARWHPYALRWEELTALWACLRQGTPSKFDADLSALLLARFVGIPMNDKTLLKTARASLETAFQAKGGFSASEARDLARSTLEPPDEEDSLWSQDPKLGWVFGGEYSCYSLRNRDHASGKEGRFPFQKFQQFLQTLPGRA